MEKKKILKEWMVKIMEEQENKNLEEMLADTQQKEQELQNIQKKEGLETENQLKKLRKSQDNQIEQTNLTQDGSLQKQQQKLQQEQADVYEAYVKEMTPTYPLWLNMLKAFLIGGLICVLGQCILNVAKNAGLDEKTAGTWCSVSLIFLSALLTGLNIYPRLAQWGGAGTLVPITGFANSVAAPAVEYQKEGQVFGIGCKIFTIAGPVILYGIFTSWLLGVLYWVLKVMEII